jgi:hypothetical protein
MRILLFGQREKKSLAVGVGRVPSLGPHHRGVGGERSSGQKRYMSKVMCFVCKKMGYYAGQCPNKKKKKGGTATTIEEA